MYLYKYFAEKCSLCIRFGILAMADLQMHTAICRYVGGSVCLP